MKEICRVDFYVCKKVFVPSPLTCKTNFLVFLLIDMFNPTRTSWFCVCHCIKLKPLVSYVRGHYDSGIGASLMQRRENKDSERHRPAWRI